MSSESPEGSSKPTPSAQSTEARERSTAARSAALAAADRCAARLQSSLIRTVASGRVLDESEEVIQQLRAAVEVYAQALRAEHFPPETTIILVTGVVGSIDAAADEEGELRRAAVKWAIDAYYAAA